MSDPMQPRVHPEELLADFVDDPSVLSPEDREVVESHLASCDRCRDEVALATRGLQAMRLLEEVPVPLGVTGPVLSKVRTERPWLTRAARPFAAAAAAAVIAIGGFTLLNSVGGSNDGSGGEDSAGAPNEASTLAMEVFDEDLSNADLDALAAETAGASALRASGDSVPEDGGGTPAATELSSPPADTKAPIQAIEVADAGPALDCLNGLEDLPATATLVRIISAGFEGTPAYLGFYTVSPGAGQDPDFLQVWVVDAETCDLLSFANRKLS